MEWTDFKGRSRRVDRFKRRERGPLGSVVNKWVKISTTKTVNLRHLTHATRPIFQASPSLTGGRASGEALRAPACGRRGAWVKFGEV
jgi:hypothetical protein